MAFGVLADGVGRCSLLLAADPVRGMSPALADSVLRLAIVAMSPPSEAGGSVLPARGGASAIGGGGCGFDNWPNDFSCRGGPACSFALE